MISHYVRTYMHKRLDNTQSKSNFTVTTCKISYWIAFSGTREHSINSN